MMNFLSCLVTLLKIIIGNISTVACKVKEEMNPFDILSGFLSKILRKLLTV